MFSIFGRFFRLATHLFGFEILCILVPIRGFAFFGLEGVFLGLVRRRSKPQFEVTMKFHHMMIFRVALQDVPMLLFVPYRRQRCLHLFFFGD